VGRRVKNFFFSRKKKISKRKKKRVIFFLRSKKKCNQKGVTAKKKMSLAAQVAEVQVHADRKIYGKRPLHASQWIGRLQRWFNITDTRGELLRLTFFSNGTLHCDRHTYFDSLSYKAKDVENEVILTDNEQTHNCEGNVCYFELDWKYKILPNPTQVQTIIRTAFQLLKECCPDVSFCLYVLTNQPRLKEDGQFKIGYHLIGYGVILRIFDNKKLAAVLDLRLSAQDPALGGLVDLESYKQAGSMLRPAFSHKMDPCPTCHLKNDLDLVKNHVKKRKCPTMEKDEPLVKWLPCNCHAGKIVNSNYYSLGFLIRSEDGVVMEQSALPSYSIEYILRHTSIIPPIGSHFTEITETSDWVQESDIVARNKSVTHPRANGQLSRKSNVMDPREFPEQYHFMTHVVREFMQKHTSLTLANKIVIHRILLRGMPKEISRNMKKTFNVLVTIKGKDSRWCIYRKKQHDSNGMFFTFNWCGALKFGCYDAECKDLQKNAPREPIKDPKKFHELFINKSRVVAMEQKQEPKTSLFAKRVPDLERLKRVAAEM